ncbi:MAG: fluoride efflux transporter CrcB [Anaerolineales bacterium]|nr:fluoride efflux transporter CrcB [Anaerolineales bacterium]
MNRYLLISIGAILGANARYLVNVWAAERIGASFPYGTLLVNVSGSLVLGFIVGAAAGRLVISSDLRLLLGVGFLGAYTTFSSYAVESVELIRTGNLALGLLNIAGNNLLALAAALFGVLIAHWIG